VGSQNNTGRKNASGKRQYEKKVRHLPGNLGSGAANKNAHSPGSEWRYNVQEEVIPRGERRKEESRGVGMTVNQAQGHVQDSHHSSPNHAPSQQSIHPASPKSATPLTGQKRSSDESTSSNSYFIPPSQNNSKNRRVQNDLVGNHHLNQRSKLFKLRDKLAQRLTQSDSSKSGFVSSKQFKTALKDAGLKQTKSLKRLTKAFTNPNQENQVDYHHFLSLISPNAELDHTSAIGTGVSQEPLIVRNKGEGAAGKKKHFSNQRLDTVASVFKSSVANTRHHGESRWLPTVAHQASGIYSQIFDKFFSHDPVFTGYVDQKSFEKVIKELNIAPQQTIPSIVRDVTDTSSGRVDYNKFMQAIIEEKRGHEPSRSSTKIIKAFDPEGLKGVKAVSGGDRYHDQVFNSKVLNNEEPVTEVEKASISGVRKKNLPPQDQIAELFDHEHEVDEKAKERMLNPTNSSRTPSQQDIIMQKIRSKVYQQDASISHVFRSYDQDHDGVIQYGEFKSALDQYCGMPLSDDQLKPIFNHLDVNKTGEISYNEFAKQLTSHATPNLSSDVFGLGDARDPVKKEGRKSSKYAFASSSDNTVTDVPASTKFDREMDKLRRHISEKASIKRTTVHDLFRSLDANHDGVLSYGELRRGLDSIGVPLTDRQFEQIIMVGDNHTKGHVDFDHFASLIAGKPNDEFLFHSLIDKSFYDRRRGLRYIEEPLSKDQKLVANQKRKYVAAASEDDIAGLPVVPRQDRPLFDKLQQKLYGQEDNLRDLFRRVDANHEGRITREQFKRSLQKMGASLSSNEYERLFSHIDRNRDNSINYNEFAMFMSEDTSGTQTDASQVDQSQSTTRGVQPAHAVGRMLRSKPAQLNHFIDQLDEKGSVPYESFSTFLTENLRVPVEGTELNKLFHQMDPEKSGKIRYSNFMNFLSREQLSQPKATMSNMDSGAIGMSTIDENIIGSTPENPYFRGTKRTNKDMDNNINSVNVVGTPKRLQDELDTLAESGSKYEVSDRTFDAPDHSTIEQSQMVSPPKTPKPESKILRHSEHPLRHEFSEVSDEEDTHNDRQQSASQPPQQEEPPAQSVYSSQPRLIELQTVSGRPVSFNQFNRLCRAFDDRGEGKISQQSFNIALNRMGIDPDSHELKHITRACTKGNDVDYKKVQFVIAGLTPVPATSQAKLKQHSATQKSPLFQALREEISEKFNQKSRNLTQAFLSADANRTGVLEPEELKSTLQRFEVNLSDDKIGTIAKEYGDDQGRISLQKFIEFVKPRSFWEIQTEQKQHTGQHDPFERVPHGMAVSRSPDPVLEIISKKLEEKTANRKEAFLSLDQKKEGKIHASNLGASLERMGIMLNDYELQRLVSKFDQDGDGLIDYKDFSETVDAQRLPLTSRNERRHSTPQDRHTVALTKNIRKELMEGAQNKSLKIHEAFKALDFTKERSLDPTRFRQAITAAAGPLPEWIVDRSVRMAQNPDGTCDYERFLCDIGVEVPQYNQHTYKVPSPTIPTRHQHYHSTSELLSSVAEQVPSIQERSISPRRGVFHPVDSGDIIAHRGPVRESSQLFQKKTELSRQLFPRDAGPIITKRPFELDLNERMNLSPRLVRNGRYANSPLSRGNPLAYVEFGQQEPTYVYRENSRHPDETRRKKVIERAPCSTQVKLLHNSKGRAAPNHPVKAERSELKHVGFEKNKQDSVECIFKEKPLEEKPSGVKTTYSHPQKVKEALRASPDPAPPKVQNLRETVQKVLENKYPSSSVAFKHLLGQQGGNKVTLPALQQELSARANLHLSKKELRKALFDKGDALEYKDFVGKVKGERASSAPPTRPSPAHTFKLGVPNRGVNRKNFSRDIISFRY